jgi:hypothetical protein
MHSGPFEELWSILDLPGTAPGPRLASIDRLNRLVRMAGEADSVLRPVPLSSIEEAILGWMLSGQRERFWEQIAAHLSFTVPIRLPFMNNDISLVIDRGAGERRWCGYLVEAASTSIGLGATPFGEPELRDADEIAGWLCQRLRAGRTGGGGRAPSPRQDDWDSIGALVDVPQAVLDAWELPLGGQVEADREVEPSLPVPRLADLAWLRRATAARIERILVAGQLDATALPRWAPSATRTFWSALDAWQAARHQRAAPPAIQLAAAGDGRFASAARAWLIRFERSSVGAIPRRQRCHG